jgi:flagellar biosynthesis/type III secretory pathway chaperone
MKPESLELYKKLELSLNELIKVYRHLLGVVRKEKDILISANLNDLNENNKSKEAMLNQAHKLEEDRILITKNLALSESLNESTRLKELARHLESQLEGKVGIEMAERFRNLQTVLELLLTRVKEHNLQNEILVKSALNRITGAMGSICETLADKPTYKKTGDITNRPTDSGQLVSKEA